MSNGLRERTPSRKARRVAEIEVWLSAQVAELLNVNLAEIDPNKPLERYGLDSAAAISLTGDLGDWLGENIDPALLYDFPTIRAVAIALGESSATQALNVAEGGSC